MFFIFSKFLKVYIFPDTLITFQLLKKVGEIPLTPYCKIKNFKFLKSLK